MAALLEGTSLTPLARAAGLPAPNPDPAGMTAGLAYVSRCLRGHRPFGTLTGSTQGINALMELVRAHCEAWDDLHVIRVAQPTDSIQAFLTACLGQLGFELFQAGLDDLHNLLVVFLRHESARGRRTVAIIERTEQFGPRVLEFMQTLSKVRAGTTPAITFLLSGSPRLHRVLDSQGMAGLRQFTRERFDLDRRLAWVASTGQARALPAPWTNGNRGMPPHTAGSRAGARTVIPALVVMLDGAIIERRALPPGTLLIGRSPKTGLHLNSRYVSRHHAALIATAEATTVLDLCSTNTTLLNGSPVTNHRLEHGDLLAIGNFRLRYDSRGL